MFLNFFLNWGPNAAKVFLNTYKYHHTMTNFIFSILVYLSRPRFVYAASIPANVHLHEEIFKTSSWGRIYSRWSYIFGRFLQCPWSRPIYSSSSYVSKMSSRRFQDVRKKFSRLQDVLKMSSRRLTKTSSRHLQDLLPRCLAKAPWRRLQKIFKTFCKDAFKISSRRFQDVIKLNCTC